MNLLTARQKARFREIGPQWGKEDPIVVAKFVTSTPGVMWAMISYVETEHVGYGFISGLPDSPEHGEWAYFSLDELELFRILPHGDRARPAPGFHESRLSEVLANAGL